MARIISVHSFRGGTGKSNTTANIATYLASKGQRVGVIDTDIQSPGIHVLFALDPSEVDKALNDFLWGRCRIEEAAYDVSSRLGAPVDGKVFLIPSSLRTGEITRVLRDGYDVSLLHEGLQALIRELSLDTLLVDTHPGLNEETLLSIAVSDVLVIIMRPDQQDYQGTGVTVEVARSLEVPRIMLVVNKTPSSFDHEDVEQRVAATYACEVAAVIPHSDDLMALASAGIMLTRFPRSDLAALYRKLGDRLLRS
ncbi:MAG: MinD/ParA family protein [Myxococcales bacterium]|nr:MinD/ParA family protein [Myxococcales bacterium]MCB9718145.1 MinD/ParA family protein [Myxococcales bacterium]